MLLFWKGCILGFSIAAPVGPIGLLCIRRTLSNGRIAGFVSGLGAATADLTYACIAALGITVILEPLIDWQPYIRVLGGLFLLYLGVKTFRERPSEEAAEARGNSLLRCFSTTLALTFTNPMTVLSFAAMFAGLGATDKGGTAVAAGVFAGSCCWWMILAGIAGAARDRLRPTHLQWLSRVAGMLIVGFAITAFLQK